MSDIYKEMIEKPHFAARESFIAKGMREITHELLGRNLYERLSSNEQFFVVDGLCVAYEGITQVYFDMATGGRTTVSNTEPGLRTPQLAVRQATFRRSKLQRLDPFRKWGHIHHLIDDYNSTKHWYQT